MATTDAQLSHAEVLALAELVCPSLNGPSSYALRAHLEGAAADGDDPLMAKVARSAADLDPGRVAHWNKVLHRADWQLLTVQDPDYPSNLRMIPDRPPFLFVRGWLRAEDERAVAVVGTRSPSADGERLAQGLTTALVGHGFTIVSGLAAGIDTVAHGAALAADGRTLAVFGTGIDRTYPAVNRQLADRITAAGAVLSQFWPDTNGARWTFPVRNIVTSGLSLATVVIEAGETSGARQQASRAIEHGKVLLLSEELVRVQGWAADLVKIGRAAEFTSADDVLENLAPELARDAEFV